MQIPRDVGVFVIAVFSYWQSYVTGGAITALVAFGEKLTGRTLPRGSYLVMFLLVFLPMSFFMAWRDQYKVAIKFDDRERQQEKADEYAPLVDHGRSLMVKWVDASLKKDDALIVKYRADSFEWLTKVRNMLNMDFGPAVALARFNLGKPSDMNLGLSEPREHEARVVELSKMVQEMRSGQLPLRTKSGD
jgi:hypothetical protein